MPQAYALESGSDLVLDVFVTARIHDVLYDNRSYIVVEDESPHSDDSNRQAVRDEQNDLVLQAVADVDGGNDETRVREDHGPPPKMEVLGT